MQSKKKRMIAVCFHQITFIKTDNCEWIRERETTQSDMQAQAWASFIYFISDFWKYLTGLFSAKPSFITCHSQEDSE